MRWKIIVIALVLFVSCYDVKSVRFKESDDFEPLDKTNEILRFADTLLMYCRGEYELNEAYENLRVKELVGHYAIIEREVDFVVWDEEDDQKYVRLHLTEDSKEYVNSIDITVI